MKKIISLLVITTMIFSMVASLNITIASAEVATMHEFKFFKESDSRLYDNSNLTGSKYFQISGNDQVGKITYHEKGVDRITTEPVIDVISDKYIWNNNAKLTFTKKVVDISFQFYIPSNKYYDANGNIMPRKFFVSFSKLNTADSSKKYNNSRYGGYTLKFPADDGYVEGSVTSNPVKVYDYNDKFIVSPDKWHEVNYRLITNEDSEGTKTLHVGMYVDGTLIQMYKSPTAYEVAFNDIGIQQVFFDTTKETSTAANPGVNQDATTYIKNFKVTQEDSAPELFSQVFFEKIYNNENGGFSVGDRSNTKVSLVASTSATTSQYYNKTSATFRNYDKINDNGAMKFTLTPHQTATHTFATIQNFRKVITDKFPENTTKYMQMSYDVMQPEGSESATKEQIWKFGTNTDSDYTNTPVFNVGSRMNGDGIYIFNDYVYDGDETTKKSVVFEDVKVNKWYRIIITLKVTNSGSNYNIHTDGYVKELASDKTFKIYESDEVVHKLNGEDGFVLTQQRTDIITQPSPEQTPVVAYIDNILSRISDDEFTNYNTGIYTDMLPEDSEYNFNIELSCLDYKNVFAKARYDAGIGSKKLIIASYDVNGKLVDIKVSELEDVAEDNKTVTLNMQIDSTTKEVRTLKAFFFEDLSTAKPLAKATRIVDDYYTSGNKMNHFLQKY